MSHIPARLPKRDKDGAPGNEEREQARRGKKTSAGRKSNFPLLANAARNGAPGFVTILKLDGL